MVRYLLCFTPILQNQLPLRNLGFYQLTSRHLQIYSTLGQLENPTYQAPFFLKTFLLPHIQFLLTLTSQ